MGWERYPIQALGQAEKNKVNLGAKRLHGRAKRTPPNMEFQAKVWGSRFAGELRRPITRGWRGKRTRAIAPVAPPPPKNCSHGPFAWGWGRVPPLSNDRSCLMTDPQSDRIFRSDPVPIATFSHILVKNYRLVKRPTPCRTAPFGPTPGRTATLVVVRLRGGVPKSLGGCAPVGPLWSYPFSLSRPPLPR
jgi:hypothetical protein